MYRREEQRKRRKHAEHLLYVCRADIRSSVRVCVCACKFISIEPSVRLRVLIFILQSPGDYSACPELSASAETN